MKPVQALLLSALLSAAAFGSALAVETKPAFKADPAKGQALACKASTPSTWSSSCRNSSQASATTPS